MTEMLQKDCIVYTLYIYIFTLYLFIFTAKICTGFSPVGRANVPTQPKKPICSRPFSLIRFSLIQSFFCARPFDQDLGPTPICFFICVQTIRPNYMILFHIFFLQCTTIRPKIWVFIDIFFSFAHDHSTKIYDLLFFIYSFFLQVHLTKIRVLINLLFTFVHNHSTKLGSLLT